MDGYELVQAFHERNGTRGLSLEWEWLGKVRDPFAPQIEFEAKTGWSNEGPVNSSLSDKAVLQLWDVILNSIRVRPTTEAKTSQTAPVQPLGHLAVTGRTCDQTGLWECDEIHAIEGHRRRFISAGETMPYTVILSKPTLWERLRGISGIRARIATMWKLIGYDEEVVAAMKPATGDNPPLPSANAIHQASS